MSVKPMTRTEREDLKKLARDRARVAKADCDRRTADLKAMFEKQLIAVYDYNRDEVWKKAVEEASKAVDAAQEEISRRCEQLGIPAELAPRVTFTWERTGPYAVASQQQGLRRAAYKRIEAMERTAKHEIDRRLLDIQTELVTDGLTSGRAVEFLRSMPSVDALMPEINLLEIDGNGHVVRGELDDEIGF